MNRTYPLTRGSARLPLTGSVQVAPGWRTRVGGGGRGLVKNRGRTPCKAENLCRGPLFDRSDSAFHGSCCTDACKPKQPTGGVVAGVRFCRSAGGWTHDRFSFVLFGADDLTINSCRTVCGLPEELEANKADQQHRPEKRRVLLTSAVTLHAETPLLWHYVPTLFRRMHMSQRCSQLGDDRESSRYFSDK